MSPEALKLELREAALNYARKRNLTIDESPTSAVIFFNLGANIHPESFEAITGRDAWHVRTQKRHPNVADALEMQSSNSSDALLMSIFCHPNIREWKGVRNLMVDILDQVCFGFNAEVCVNSGQADATEIDMALTGALCEAKLTEADFTAKSSDAVERYDGLQEAFHIDELSRVREQQYDNYQIIRNLLASIQHGKRHLMLCDERRPDLVRRYMQTVACLKHIEHRKKCAVIFWQEIARACGESLRSWLDEKYGIS